eukprot:SAG11_NODE_8088_length_1061_cov_1.250520_1_plen_203_part_10
MRSTTGAATADACGLRSHRSWRTRRLRPASSAWRTPPTPGVSTRETAAADGRWRPSPARAGTLAFTTSSTPRLRTPTRIQRMPGAHLCCHRCCCNLRGSGGRGVDARAAECRAASRRHVKVRFGGAVREYTPVSTAADWEAGRLDLLVKTYAAGTVSRRFALLRQAVRAPRALIISAPAGGRAPRRGGVALPPTSAEQLLLAG